MKQNSIFLFVFFLERLLFRGMAQTKWVKSLAINASFRYGVSCGTILLRLSRLLGFQLQVRFTPLPGSFCSLLFPTKFFKQVSFIKFCLFRYYYFRLWIDKNLISLFVFGYIFLSNHLFTSFFDHCILNLKCFQYLLLFIFINFVFHVTYLNKSILNYVVYQGYGISTCTVFLINWIGVVILAMKNASCFLNYTLTFCSIR